MHTKNTNDKFMNRYRNGSARLQKWDYGWNASYFITICTYDRKLFFGNISDCVMILNDIGQIAKKFWFEIPNHFEFVELGAFVVMPNHIHGIIIINKTDDHCRDKAMPDNRRDKALPCPYGDDVVDTDKTIGQSRFRNPGKNNISSIIGSYKSVVTKHSRLINPEFAWQSRFYDHIIRDDKSFKNISKYIDDNPAKWDFK
ncbi:MAG: hypothetical protein KGZ71_09205 [Desulfobulbaceae bacterium]|nr:hypothetical protein [Desulfobulbaceae bacterium]